MTTNPTERLGLKHIITNPGAFDDSAYPYIRRCETHREPMDAFVTKLVTTLEVVTLTDANGDEWNAAIPSGADE